MNTGITEKKAGVLSTLVIITFFLIAVLINGILLDTYYFKKNIKRVGTNEIGARWVFFKQNN
ncbi:MAG: hypothetical protein LWX07_11730 [Bacteroidetes bacterium]|nr:hypothetical protein [Bacteroidota bacterium]